MPLLGPNSPDARREKLRSAAEALETLVLKSLVTSSRAFSGGESAGSGIRADMFADALAGAMVKGGGIGLTRQILRTMGEADANANPRSTPNPTATLASTPLPAPTGALRPGSDLSTSPADALHGAARVTSPFGLRADPFDGHLARHAGVDLAAGEGEPILAARGGVVRSAGPRGGYGNAVEVDHGDGLTTLYAHASELLVREGDRVEPGQPLGKVGHTGRATGAHLHFEVRKGGMAVDPTRALKNYARRVEESLGSSS